MAKYKVAPGHRFVDPSGAMSEAGDTVSYDGEPGENLLPLDAEGRKAKAAAAKGMPRLQADNEDLQKQIDELKAENAQLTEALATANKAAAAAKT